MAATNQPTTSGFVDAILSNQELRNSLASLQVMYYQRPLSDKQLQVQPQHWLCRLYDR